jgi:hypothetical protein
MNIFFPCAFDAIDIKSTQTSCSLVSDFARRLLKRSVLCAPQPNGRFEVGKKICLSISAHHPEHWQPAWGSESLSKLPSPTFRILDDWIPAETSRERRALDHDALLVSSRPSPDHCVAFACFCAVRLILEALISFFPTDPKGAVGSLDWTPAERSRLAKEVGP